MICTGLPPCSLPWSTTAGEGHASHKLVYIILNCVTIVKKYLWEAFQIQSGNGTLSTRSVSSVISDGEETISLSLSKAIAINTLRGNRGDRQ